MSTAVQITLIICITIISIIGLLCWLTAKFKD